MNWYLTCLKEHYADFKGRARRKEYWMFVPLNVIVSMVLTILGGLIKCSWIGSLYSLAVLVPSLAVSVRRLHDTGRSGWWILISLIPVVGAIWLIVLPCLDSQPEANEWGEKSQKGLRHRLIEYEKTAQCEPSFSFAGESGSRHVVFQLTPDRCVDGHRN